MNLALILGSIIVIAVVAAISLNAFYGLKTQALTWWFHGNRAAAQVNAYRENISEKWGVTLPDLSRDGSARIAAGETKKWRSPYLADELSAYLGEPIKISVSGGRVRFTTGKTVGHSTGQASFTSSGLVLGVDAETGEPVTLEIRENSGMVVGGLPGSGKTVLLEKMINALKAGGAGVVTFDGKVESPDDAQTTLELAQKMMEMRLADGLDFWQDTQGEKLTVLVLDEVQTLFSGLGKEEKAAAEKRAKIIRDLIQRGRSAGVLVVLATQRPTADVIPTAIRDICGIRVCGRVSNPVAVEVVLGRRPELGEPNPARFTTPGRFVFDDGRSDWREVQIYA